ncbi:MAG TPA: hemerythrin domain-containing protein [Nevskiaceae bacterium]|nr:hemerythrin domain-containing protein [Nevskiaceae bacterium]
MTETGPGAEPLSVRSTLSADHRDIDAVIDAVSTQAVEPAALMRALDELLRHFYVEEQLVFPPLLETGLVMPIQIMQQEHGEMWPMWQKLVEACATGEVDARSKRRAHELYLHLRVHNPKEEEVVYAAADAWLAGHPESTLLADLQHATVPTGWRCAAFSQAST